MARDPEAYYFAPTLHVPNSKLPALIYRKVLPPDPTASNTREMIERNNWLQGGVFKTYRAHHFHSVTHECYAVFKGKSRLLLGRGPLDDPDDGGVEVNVEVGDIIVLPVRQPVGMRNSKANESRLVSVTALSIRRVAMSMLDCTQRAVPIGTTTFARRIARKLKQRRRLQERCQFQSLIRYTDVTDHWYEYGVKHKLETFRGCY
jgi:uncharacterized protein YjlB